MNNYEKLKQRHPLRRDIILIIVLLLLILLAIIFPRFKELREPIQETEIIYIEPEVKIPPVGGNPPDPDIVESLLQPVHERPIPPEIIPDTLEHELPDLEIPEGTEFLVNPPYNNSKIDKSTNSKKPKIERPFVKRILTAEDIWKRHFEIYVQSDPDLPEPGFGKKHLIEVVQSRVSFSKQPSIFGGPTSIYEKLDYPEFLEKMGISATINVEVTIETDGLASAAEITGYRSKCKFYEFEKAACDVMQKIKFIPAECRDKPVSSRMRIPVEFISNTNLDSSEQIVQDSSGLFFGLPVDPPYPLLAGSWKDLNALAIQKAGPNIKEFTVIRTYIDTSGTVLRAQPIWPSTKYPNRDKAAIEVIKKTKFKPAMLRGKIPVGVWFNIPVIYKLD